MIRTCLQVLIKNVKTFNHVVGWTGIQFNEPVS